MTSSSYDVDDKGDIFRLIIYPRSFTVIALIFSETSVFEDQKKPGLNKVNYSLHSLSQGAALYTNKPEKSTQNTQTFP